MKKIFQLLVVLLLFMQPMTIFAKAKQLTSTITWELKKDGTLIISGTGKMPDMDRDKYPWAKRAKKITSVKIGEGITYISKSSFSSYRAGDKKSYQISTVSLPSTLNEIAYEAFRANKISSLVIPNSVVKIDNYAFSGNAISVLYIPSSLKVISSGAFQYNAISSLTIPDGVVEIGSTAFRGNKLKVLSIPSSLTKIGYAAFANNNIASLEIPNNITELGAEAFSYCGIKSLTLHGKIKDIPAGAFKGNKITSLVIPEGVTNVRDNAFQNCGITTLSLPSSLLTIGQYAFAENNFTNVKIPEGVKKIGDYAFFKALPSYATLEVANSVKSIGDFAFGWKNSKYASDCEYFEGTILNLPAIVTEKNYYDIGIAYSSFEEYSPTFFALFNKAFDYWDKQDNWEKARECYERCLTDPRVRDVRLKDKAHCTFMLGRYYYDAKKDYHTALKYFEKAQYLGEDGIDNWIIFAKENIEKQVNDSLEIKYRDAVQEALRKNNHAQAFDYYVKLYKILRCKTEELHSIPKYFEDRKDYATAIKYFKEAYSVENNSLWVANHIAELYLITKNYEEAIKWGSIHAQTGDKEGQYKLGKIYEKAKNKNLAIFWYKKAAEQKHLKAEEALAHYGVYINTQQSAPSSSQQTTQTSSSQSKTSSSSSQSNTYTPEYGLRDVWVQCWVCHGSGKCEHCHGNGQYISTRGDGSFNSLDKCQPCYGSGRCYMCNGTGGHYEKQSYQIR